MQWFKKLFQKESRIYPPMPFQQFKCPTKFRPQAFIDEYGNPSVTYVKSAFAIGARGEWVEAPGIGFEVHKEYEHCSDCKAFIFRGKTAETKHNSLHHQAKMTDSLLGLIPLTTVIFPEPGGETNQYLYGTYTAEESLELCHGREDTPTDETLNCIDSIDMPIVEEIQVMNYEGTIENVTIVDGDYDEYKYHYNCEKCDLYIPNMAHLLYKHRAVHLDKEWGVPRTEKALLSNGDCVNWYVIHISSYVGYLEPPKHSSSLLFDKGYDYNDKYDMFVPVDNPEAFEIYKRKLVMGEEDTISVPTGRALCVDGKYKELYRDVKMSPEQQFVATSLTVRKDREKMMKRQEDLCDTKCADNCECRERLQAAGEDEVSVKGNPDKVDDCECVSCATDALTAKLEPKTDTMTVHVRDKAGNIVGTAWLGQEFTLATREEVMAIPFYPAATFRFERRSPANEPFDCVVQDHMNTIPPQDLSDKEPIPKKINWDVINGTLIKPACFFPPAKVDTVRIAIDRDAKYCNKMWYIEHKGKVHYFSLEECFSTDIDFYSFTDRFITRSNTTEHHLQTNNQQVAIIVVDPHGYITRAYNDVGDINEFFLPSTHEFFRYVKVSVPAKELF